MSTDRKFSLLIAVFIALVGFLLLSSGFVYADDPCKKVSESEQAECYAKEIEKSEKKYESTSKKLSDIRSQKDSVTQQITALLGQLTVKDSELAGIQAEIDDMTQQLEEINENLTDRNGKLDEKIKLRNTVVRNYSKRGVLNDLETFIVSREDLGLNGFQFSTISYIFQKTLNEESVRLIKTLNTEITNFTKDKEEAESLKGELEDAQAQLLAAKSQLENAKSSQEGTLDDLSGKEDDLDEDLKELEKEIAELSSKQQAILQAKSGDFSASLSEGVDTDDSRTSINYNPGFSPAFAAFSYGAYTHRNGMSQYGARGRAEDGQDYKEILKFYYKSGVDEKDDLDDKKICVQGVSDSMKLGDYLKGLGEMPPSWDMDALKAQVVAARTYAYRYTKNGGCICTTTNCQYFSKDLMDRSDRTRWYDAIKDTKNEILSADVSAQYSSTTGGWINGVGWDVDGNWPNDAYEKEGNSPWFYKAWFTKEYRRESSTCGRAHPWLNSEEMADVLNAYVLLKAGKNTERVVPETINDCSISGVSGKPYSKSDLRKKAEDVDKGFSKVTNVSNVKYSEGRTTSLTFSTDKGEYTVDGQLFMEAFNIRAPGYIAIKYSPDSKALYEIVKK